MAYDLNKERDKTPSKHTVGVRVLKKRVTKKGSKCPFEVEFYDVTCSIATVYSQPLAAIFANPGRKTS